MEMIHSGLAQQDRAHRKIYEQVAQTLMLQQLKQHLFSACSDGHMGSPVRLTGGEGKVKA